MGRSGGGDGGGIVWGVRRRAGAALGRGEGRSDSEELAAHCGTGGGN